MNNKAQSHKTVDLATLLTAQISGLAYATSDEGDQALFDGQYELAVETYAKVANPSKAVRAKHGYCLSVGSKPGTLELLNLDNVGPHSTARAMLAWAISQAHPRRMSDVQRETCRELLQSVLDDDLPSQLALYALLDMWFQVGLQGRPLDQAERAMALYPKARYMLGIGAREQRLAGKFPQSTLDLLSETFASPSAGDQIDLIEEAYNWSIASKDWALARQVLETIRTPAAKAPEDLNALAILSAFVDLQHGRAGNRDALLTGWETIKPWLTSSPEIPGQRALENACLALCIAAELDDEACIALAVKLLIEFVYDASLESMSMMDIAMIAVYLPSHADSMRVEITLPLSDYTDRITARLGSHERIQYRLMTACRAVEDGADVKVDRDEIRAHGPLFGPRCGLGPMMFSLMSSHADGLTGVGTLLARFSVLAEDRPGDTDLHETLRCEEEALSALDDDQIHEVFEEIYLAMDERDVGTGEVVLKLWGELLQARAPDLLALFGSRYEKRTSLPAPLPVPPPDPLARALSQYPGPQACPKDPATLSLLQAAILIALLRGEMDHSGWTVAPLGSGNGPFEPEAPGHPQRRFASELFNLAEMGVVGFSDRTPKGVINPGEHGTLSAYMERVVWAVSPQTLALQREIRDMPRDAWPDAWRQSAPLLARDIGAQELLSYMLLLCDQRSLPRPDQDELLPVFRELMEKRSVAHGYYLAAKTVREALDYQVKYRAGAKQVLSRMTNLLRGNIERSLEQGWDTLYRRDHDIPQSQLFSALHDVLTGWGQRAFDEPVFELSL